MQEYGAGSDTGKVRKNNEDSFVCDTKLSLWLVADGMGGLGYGEAASAISAYAVTTQIREGHGVNQAIDIAHREIKDFSTKHAMNTNMGTTLVLLKSTPSLYNIFWIGDSRAYLFDGDLKQLTVDHSFVQVMVDMGEITPEEARVDPRRNAVTRALGVDEFHSVKADSISDRWRSGQKILLCTDGLTDIVSDREIEKILQGKGTDQHKVDKLIEASLQKGGNDNVTIVIVSAPESATQPNSDTDFPDTERERDDMETRTASTY